MIFRVFNIKYKQCEFVLRICLEFGSTSVAVMENIGVFQVYLLRSGKMNNEVRVRVDTVDGTAEEGPDYRGVHDTFVFKPFQTEVEIDLEILDDDDWEPDEEFFLKISLLPNSENSGVIKIGKRHIMTIKILNDDLPGTFQFEKRAYFVKESCGKAEIIVIREIGADGDVEVGTGYRVQSTE